MHVPRLSLILYLCMFTRALRLFAFLSFSYKLFDEPPDCTKKYERDLNALRVAVRLSS